MQRAGGRCGIVLVGVAFAALLISSLLTAETPAARTASLPATAKDGTSQPVPPPDAKHLGVASCAASNCHGGPLSRGVHGSEYSAWIQWDPHAQAYSQLLGKRSREMAEKLGPARLGSTSAATAQRCLVCHAVPATSARNENEYQTIVQDGIGCESCHGGAETWRKLHTQLDWKQKPSAQKQELGFRDLQHLVPRARLCVECHVGSPGRDVDHDLIAAGHPRLNFELNAYLAKLPAHWDRKRDEREIGNEATVWRAGQVIAAEAAARQLARRAESIPQGVWPEFSEYDCFSCHHDLKDPSWRQRSANAAGPLGVYRWGTWYFPLWDSQQGEPLVSDSLGTARSEVQTELQALRKLLARPLPDRAAVATQASALSGQLATCAATIGGKQLTQAEARQLLRRIAIEGQQLTPRNWDAAAQVYLAAFAAFRGAVKSPAPGADFVKSEDRQIQQALDNIQKVLQFPQQPNYDSPKTFEPEAVERINAELQKIVDSLKAE